MQSLSNGLKTFSDAPAFPAAMVRPNRSAAVTRQGRDRPKDRLRLRARA